MHGADAQEPTTLSLRFDDTALFLQFHHTQLTRRLLDLPTTAPLMPGAEVTLSISVPGAEQPVTLPGRVVHRAAGGRARIRLAPGHDALTWLSGYVAALALAHAGTATPASNPDDPRNLGERLSRLTYYELLGTPRDAEAATIQRAFHGLSRQYHPDLFFGLAPERLARVTTVFRRINEAYSVLRVPERRRGYDRGLAGPRHRWQLRFQEAQEAEEPKDRAKRGAHYWARAGTRLSLPRPPSAPPDAAALRLLRTACAFEPENLSYRRALDRLLSGRIAPVFHRS